MTKYILSYTPTVRDKKGYVLALNKHENIYNDNNYIVAFNPWSSYSAEIIDDMVGVRKMRVKASRVLVKEATPVVNFDAVIDEDPNLAIRDGVGAINGSLDKAKLVANAKLLPKELEGGIYFLKTKVDDAVLAFLEAKDGNILKFMGELSTLVAKDAVEVGMQWYSLIKEGKATDSDEFGDKVKDIYQALKQEVDLSRNVPFRFMNTEHSIGTLLHRLGYRSDELTRGEDINRIIIGDRVGTQLNAILLQNIYRALDVALHATKLNPMYVRLLSLESPLRKTNILMTDKGVNMFEKGYVVFDTENENLTPVDVLGGLDGELVDTAHTLSNFRYAHEEVGLEPVVFDNTVFNSEKIDRLEGGVVDKVKYSEKIDTIKKGQKTEVLEAVVASRMTGKQVTVQEAMAMFKLDNAILRVASTDAVRHFGEKTTGKVTFVQKLVEESKATLVLSVSGEDMLKMIKSKSTYSVYNDKPLDYVVPTIAFTSDSNHIGLENSKLSFSVFGHVTEEPTKAVFSMTDSVGSQFRTYHADIVFSTSQSVRYEPVLADLVYPSDIVYNTDLDKATPLATIVDSTKEKADKVIKYTFTEDVIDDRLSKAIQMVNKTEATVVDPKMAKSVTGVVQTEGGETVSRVVSTALNEDSSKVALTFNNPTHVQRKTVEAKNVVPQIIDTLLEEGKAVFTSNYNVELGEARLSTNWDVSLTPSTDEGKISGWEAEVHTLDEYSQSSHSATVDRMYKGVNEVTEQATVGKGDIARDGVLFGKKSDTIDKTLTTALEAYVDQGMDVTSATTLSATRSDKFTVTTATTLNGVQPLGFDVTKATALQATTAQRLDKTEATALIADKDQGLDKTKATALQATSAEKLDNTKATALQATTADKFDNSKLTSLQATTAERLSESKPTALQADTADKLDSSKLTALRTTVDILDDSEPTALQANISQGLDNSEPTALRANVSQGLDKAEATPLQANISQGLDNAEATPLPANISQGFDVTEATALQATTANTLDNPRATTLQAITDRGLSNVDFDLTEQAEIVKADEKLKSFTVASVDSMSVTLHDVKLNAVGRGNLEEAISTPYVAVNEDIVTAIPSDNGTSAVVMGMEGAVESFLNSKGIDKLEGVTLKLSLDSKLSNFSKGKFLPSLKGIKTAGFEEGKFDESMVDTVLSYLLEMSDSTLGIEVEYSTIDTANSESERNVKDVELATYNSTEGKSVPTKEVFLQVVGTAEHESYKDLYVSSMDFFNGKDSDIEALVEKLEKFQSESTNVVEYEKLTEARFEGSGNEVNLSELEGTSTFSESIEASIQRMESSNNDESSEDILLEVLEIASPALDGLVLQLEELSGAKQEGAAKDVLLEKITHTSPISGYVNTLLESVVEGKFGIANKDVELRQLSEANHTMSHKDILLEGLDKISLKQGVANTLIEAIQKVSTEQAIKDTVIDRQEKSKNDLGTKDTVIEPMAKVQVEGQSKDVAMNYIEESQRYVEYEGQEYDRETAVKDFRVAAVTSDELESSSVQGVVLDIALPSESEGGDRTSQMSLYSSGTSSADRVNNLIGGELPKDLEGYTKETRLRAEEPSEASTFESSSYRDITIGGHDSAESSTVHDVQLSMDGLEGGDRTSQISGISALTEMSTKGSSDGLMSIADQEGYQKDMRVKAETSSRIGEGRNEGLLDIDFPNLDGSTLDRDVRVGISDADFGNKYKEIEGSDDGDKEGGQVIPTDPNNPIVPQDPKQKIWSIMGKNYPSWQNWNPKKTR